MFFQMFWWTEHIARWLHQLSGGFRGIGRLRLDGTVPTVLGRWSAVISSNTLWNLWNKNMKEKYMFEWLFKCLNVWCLIVDVVLYVSPRKTKTIDGFATKNTCMNSNPHWNWGLNPGFPISWTKLSSLKYNKFHINLAANKNTKVPRSQRWWVCSTPRYFPRSHRSASPERHGLNLKGRRLTVRWKRNFGATWQEQNFT